MPLRAILVDEGLAHPQIEAIKVGCGQMTFVHTAWEYRPVGITAAQMNIYYGLAVMALRGEVSAADYTEGAISDPAILAFIPRISVSVDQELEEMGAAFRHAARLVVRTVDGRTLKREIYHLRRGSPENPVSRQDVERKFVSNVDTLLGRSSIDRLKELASQLEGLANVDELVKIIGASFEGVTAQASQLPSAAEVEWASPSPSL